MKRVTHLLSILFLALMAACSSQQDESADTDTAVGTEAVAGEAHPEPTWRGVLKLTAEEIPFNFRYDPGAKSPMMTILNADEEIEVTEITLKGDTTVIQLPWFDSEFRVVVQENAIDGFWHNHARKNKNRIAFAATKGSHRFMEQPEAPSANMTGYWEVTFVYKETDTSKANGHFIQRGNALTGTFMTPTGDYRFLEGSMNGDQLLLSCFDGAHAFLFKAQLQADGALVGGFWSGDHWYEDWTAIRNAGQYKLPDPDSLTWVKPGERFAFSFPNAEGETVSLDDPQYDDKVVVVQVMGTWCPNCKDETAFLADFYREHKDKGLEVVALAFERTDEFAKAQRLLKRMKAAFGLEYEMLHAGRAGRETAGSALPMLNHVMSYPTTIFLDRNKAVRRVHTGFNGPATGDRYTRFVEDFTDFVLGLLSEDGGWQSSTS